MIGQIEEVLVHWTESERCAGENVRMGPAEFASLLADIRADEENTSRCGYCKVKATFCRSDGEDICDRFDVTKDPASIDIDAVLRPWGVRWNVQPHEPDASKRNGVELDGIEVELFRSEIDGRIVVHVSSTDASDHDHHTPGGVPKIRIGVNDEYENLDPDGSWEKADRNDVRPPS